MQEKRYNESKKEIRSVLLTYQKGTSLDEFLKSYKQLLGGRLPSRELGFNSDVEFLRSMPDVVHISTNNFGRVQLFGVADEASEHIQKLVSRQRAARPNNKSYKSLSRPKIFRTESNVKEISKFSNPSFVPGALRAEILQLLVMYPDGITFPAFVLAYQRLFNKCLSLGKGLETLENIISAIPELEIRENKQEKKIYTRIQTKNTSTDYKDTESKFSQQKDPKSNFVKATHAIASSSFDKSGISDAVKKNFQLVLDKCSDGILAIHFPALYEKIINEPFVLHEFGYNSILELADALPNIFSRSVDPCNERNWVIFPSKTCANFKSKNHIKPNASACNGVGVQSPLKNCEGIPFDAASPFWQYQQPRMSENIYLEEYIPIFVSAIVNPSLFWFQLQTDEVIKDFEELENGLGKFYNSFASSNYKMNPAHIVIGASCVIQCPEDKQWYRAVIKSIPSSELVNVLFVDYGSRDNVPRSSLRYVKEKFFHFPAYAFRAELAGLKPANNASSWDIRSQQRFIKLCESAFIMAYLKPLKHDSFSTYLCDTNGENDLHFNDVLIDEGYAELACDTYFNRNNAVASHEIHSTSTNGIPKECDQNPTNSFESSASSTGDLSCVSINDTETLKTSFQPSAADLKVKRKLSFSLERKEPEIPEVSCIKEHCPKRYVKKVKLCEDIKFFVINMKNKPYISGGDLTKLFWNDKDHNFLAERLNYKDVIVPTIQIPREDNIDFYKQCEWFKIPDWKHFSNTDFALTLYPLEWAFNTLNIFGHPSVCLRLAIQNEIKIFDPVDPIWNEFHYDKETCLEDLETEIEAKLEKLCLYDLKAKSEALKVKRLKLLKVGSSSTSEEVTKIESLQHAVERRIAQIESICSQYASCS